MKYANFDCGCKFPVIEIDGKECIQFNPDIEELNLECKSTWDLLSSGDTKGVFQLESNLGQSITKKVQPRNIEELAAVSAILRPGCSQAIRDNKSVTQHYIDRKHLIEPITYVNDILKPILHTTMGELLYQEQAIQIVKDVAGFNLQEADELRKCITGDSLVMTNKGMRTIKFLLSKKKIDGLGRYKILSLNRKNKLVYRPLKDVWKTGQQEVFRVTTKSGYHIDATKNHLIATDLGFTAVNKLHKDDELIVPLLYKYAGTTRFSKFQVILMALAIAFGKNSVRKTYICLQTTDQLKLCTYILDKLFPGQYRVGNTDGDKYRVYLKNGAALWLKKYIGHFDNPNWYIYALSSHSLIYFLGTLLQYKGVFMHKTDTHRLEQVKIYGLRNEFAQQLHIQLLKLRLHPTLYFSFAKNNCDFYDMTIEADNTYNLVMKMYNQLLRGKTTDRTIFKTKMVKKQYVLDKIDKIESLSYKTVYDFEVEGSQHYGFVNGLLIHNSIGKKKPELMAKVEEKFLTKAREKNVVTKEEAKIIFDGIKQSQRYGFNLAHAISYALNGYLSAYAKAHFPKEFFRSYLYYSDGKIKPQEEKRALIHNARSYNIEILPPDIDLLNEKFILKDGKIYCGLSNVKNVGKNIIKKLNSIHNNILKLIGKDIKTLTWTETLILVLYHVDSDAAQSFIKVGALDKFGLPRQQMLFEYTLLKKLSDKEMKSCTELSHTYKKVPEILKALLSKPPGKLGYISSKNRIPLIESLLKLYDEPPYSLIDTTETMAKDENLLLGCSLSCGEIDSAKLYDINCNIQEFLRGVRLKKYILAGKIERMKVIKTKNGDEMCFISLADETGLLESVVLFPEAYIANINMLIENNFIMIVGNRGVSDRENSLLVEKILQI